MNQFQIYDDNTFGRCLKSLLEKLHSYFDDASIASECEGGQLVPMFKFRSLLLIAEIYEMVRLFFVNRESSLAEYFSDRTLKQCLQDIADVEDMQNSLSNLSGELKSIEDSILWNTDLAGMAGLEGLEAMPGLYEYQQLRMGGVISLCSSDNIETPSVKKSHLWKNTFGKRSSERYEKVFRGAKEDLDDVRKSFSPDINDQVYNNAVNKMSLGNRTVKEVDEYELRAISAHRKKDKSKFDFLKFLIVVQKKAETATADDILSEMRAAIELLRNALMTEAEDIYYIRTGDFSELVNTYNEGIIQKYYSEIPFMVYNQQRNEFCQQLREDIEIDLANWRCEKDYTGRPLKKDEYDEFLQDRRDNVIKNMKSYEKLWKLRKHSGGLDADVTPENFARMFYRRKGVDRYFIELQWELEELSNLIEKNKQKIVEDEQKPVITPKQKAVADFVDKIIMLAKTAYEEWNNKYASPGVHKADVFIVIKKDELIGFIQGEMKNNFEELSELCYPVSPTTKQEFCKYVMKLQKEDYFGLLPNKLLADILAPIVELSPGTVNNYLSSL